MATNNCPAFVFGPHPDDDEIMGINITEGKYKDVFFCFGKVNPYEKDDGLVLDYEYHIIGMPAIFIPSDFETRGKHKTEFDDITGNILASLLEEQISKLDVDDLI